MTAKTLKVIVGEDQTPIHDLTDYVNWPESKFMGQAYNGQSAISQIVFRDEESEFGPWTDSAITIAARNEVEVKLGSAFIWRGRLIGRTWARGIQKADVTRVVGAEAEDVNVELRGIIVDQWVRGAETDVARVQALGADYLDGSVRVGADIDVSTYVPNTNTVMLAAKTYTQTDPVGVLQDIITQSHKQFFVTLDKELFYDMWDSVAYDSGLRITEDIAELAADPTGTLAIIPDAGPLFAINGQRFISAVRLYYGAGPTDYVDASDPSMENVKAHWAETVYAPDTITTAGEAALLAEAILDERSQDGRTFTLSVRNANGGSLTEAQVALLKPGRLISIKAHVLPLATYSDYYTRIVTVQWHMPLADHYFATLKLERPEKAYGVGTKPGPLPPDEGSGFFSCDNIGAGTATGLWVNGSVETNADGWKRTPGGDPAFLTTAQAHAGTWSVQCSAHNWYFFTGQTFEEGQTYLITWWAYQLGSSTALSARIGYGTMHAVVGLDSTSKSWPDESYPAGVWVQYCMSWTPTSTWTDGVGIDFHFSGGYIDDCVVYEGVPADLPLPPAEEPVAGDPGQYAPLTHQHQQQTAGTVPYDGNDAGSSSSTVQDAIDRIHPVESATDPAVTDDAHHVGTVWVNTVAETIYVLIDNTTGAAVWQDVSEVIPDGTYITATDGGKEVVSTVAASGATETLDLADGNWHDVTLTADCTLTLTGATNGVGCSMLLLLRQDGTGGWAVTWPASVAWPGGEAPALAADPNDVTIVSLLSEDGGTTWYGAYPGAGTAEGANSNIFTVDPGAPTYDDSDPAEVLVTIVSKFGIDGSGDPYFNDAGVTAGEEAALLRDPDTGQYLLRSYNF